MTMRTEERERIKMKSRGLFHGRVGKIALKGVFLCIVAISLSGCMETTRGQWNDVLKKSSTNAGTRAGGG